MVGVKAIGRPRIFVRVIDLPDGTLRQFDAGGREIHGLSYNESNGSYYTIDLETGKRVYQSTTLEEAVAVVEGNERVNVPEQPSTYTPELWAKKESEWATIDNYVRDLEALSLAAFNAPRHQVVKVFRWGREPWRES